MWLPDLFNWFYSEDLSVSFKTADLCDAHQGKVQVLHSGLINFGGRPRFYGEIVTIKALGDFSQVREQVRSTGAGRVLVVDNDGSMQCAMLGDLLAAAAHENGWQGIVINGCVRDSADVAGMDIGVKALGCVPARGKRADQGELGVDLSFHGAVFRSGEYLYSDEDGILLSTVALI
jgi:regulator of ribonuclease activity A